MSAVALTPEQLHILQHSLGCDQFGCDAEGWTHKDRDDGRFGFYRNHYAADPFPDMDALVAAGLMRDCGARELAGGMHFYSVTLAGRDAMVAQSPKPPKLTPGQKRYREWLRADCGMAFEEWLKAKAAYERDFTRLPIQG